MIRILQGNMHRSKTADSLLHQLAIEKRAELLLLSEQYNNKEFSMWYSDPLGTAAIWVPNEAIQVKSHGSGSGFVWVKSNEITFFSCYFTPNESIATFRAKLEALEDELLRVAGQMVVAGDFNARALEWGMPIPDTRGRLILEMAARTGLIVMNVGSTTTFRRPGCKETIPDITLAHENLAPHIQSWRVMEEYSGSDHQYIEFEVTNALQQTRRNKPLRWNLQRMNIESFTSELAKGMQTDEIQNITGRDAVEELVASTTRLITSACNKSMPRCKPRHGKPPVYWWTTEIAELRRACLALRRKAQRATNRLEANRISAQHKYARKQLRRSINQSKSNCWKKLIEDVDRDPWGLGYKIVKKKLGALKPTCVMDSNTTVDIVRALFPIHPDRFEVPIDPEAEVPLFTEAELETSVLAMQNKKAPGPDGISSEVLKLIHHLNPKLLLRMYNLCLAEGVFSSRWKIGRLVLIKKNKGDPELHSSFRPLCMLDTIGKVFEKLIRARLMVAVKHAGDLSSNQYGFRAGRSTIDAIQEVTEAVRRAENHSHFARRIVLLVTLDVKNAFNSARWDDILKALKYGFHIPTYLLRILSDYFNNRTLIYDTQEGQREMEVTGGVAQGSILGPDLWNIFYDGLLRTEMPGETHLVGYADDIAVLIAARDTKQAQLKLNQVMRTVDIWMSEHGIGLALHKTEIAILTKKRIQPALPMWVGAEVIETKSAVKYLGITIDSKLSFFEQIRQTADKAAKGVTALSRLMANTGGPSASKRRLLMSSIQSVLLYGAEVWADSLRIEVYRKRLAQVQRRGALRVASAYRTVSEAAIMVIAGCIPIHLLAYERKRIYLRKTEVDRIAASQEERLRTIEAWQLSWEREEKGRWTAKLIGNVGSWFERKHGNVNYYLTQFLSGHGYFRKYLKSMGKVTTEDCLYCPGVTDDAGHTFFQCGRWEERKRSIEEDVGQWSPETAVRIMLEGDESWSVISSYVEGILKAKKADLDRMIIAEESAL